MNPIINRILYVGFVVFTVYYITVQHDLMTAASNMGIALIFDPFDQAVKWQDRPMWQRAWLIVHVAIVFGLFGYAMLVK